MCLGVSDGKPYGLHDFQHVGITPIMHDESTRQWRNSGMVMTGFCEFLQLPVTFVDSKGHNPLMKEYKLARHELLAELCT